VTPDRPAEQPVTDASAAGDAMMDGLAAAGIAEDDDPDGPGVIAP